jgi:hypothetical protein
VSVASSLDLPNWEDSGQTSNESVRDTRVSAIDAAGFRFNVDDIVIRIGDPLKTALDSIVKLTTRP